MFVFPLTQVWNELSCPTFTAPADLNPVVNAPLLPLITTRNRESRHQTWVFRKLGLLAVVLETVLLALFLLGSDAVLSDEDLDEVLEADWFLRSVISSLLSPSETQNVRYEPQTCSPLSASRVRLIVLKKH